MNLSHPGSTLGINASAGIKASSAFRLLIQASAYFGHCYTFFRVKGKFFYWTLVSIAKIIGVAASMGTSFTHPLLREKNKLYNIYPFA